MSRELKGERVVVYPAYIDSRLPRRLGRRISRDEAVPSPRIDEIEAAARRLGLDPIVEEHARYPRTWFYQRGRVLILKKWSKQESLRRIAAEILEMRRRRSKRL